MSKVHPTGNNSELVGLSATTWTVWKKSSMGFEGTDGFSVYDGEGRLKFRVDNYSRRRKYLSGEILLMDGGGRALLALRPQIFSIHDRWNGFKPEKDSTAGAKSPVFALRRRFVLQNRDEAEVFIGESLTPDFCTEGSFSRRCCKIRDRTGDEVARISRKNASSSVVLGDDVFSLVVNPGVDCQLMVAIVVVMDRICEKPFAPLICS